MEMSPALLQFLGSLVAILALAGIAGWLGLGGDRRITSEAEARILADEAVSGFSPVATAVDAGGQAAVLHDAQGRVLILRRHGAQFAGRLLDEGATAAADGQCLQVDTGEVRFGSVMLQVKDPQAWVRTIEAIGSSKHA